MIQVVVGNIFTAGNIWIHNFVQIVDLVLPVCPDVLDVAHLGLALQRIVTNVRQFNSIFSRDVFNLKINVNLSINKLNYLWTVDMLRRIYFEDLLLCTNKPTTALGNL